MFKRGIISIDELKHPINWLGKPKPVSYTLLQTSEHPSDEEIGAFEKLIQTVRLRSKVYRTTYKKRFEALDAVVDEVLKLNVNKGKPLIVYDWGVSDARTSYEWLEKLSQWNDHVDLVASDLIFYLIQVDSPRGEKWIFEPDGGPLQYIRPPFVLSFLQPESWAYPVNRAILQKGAKQLKGLSPIVEKATWNKLEDLTTVCEGEWTIRKILLIHPVALKAVREGRLRLEIHDAFTPVERQCHVLRSMNLYNRSYFTPEKLRLGIQSVWATLEDRGIWIVGRTQEEKAREMSATVFQKEKNRFLALTRIGGGSEIEDLVLQ